MVSQIWDFLFKNAYGIPNLGFSILKCVWYPKIEIFYLKMRMVSKIWDFHVYFQISERSKMRNQILYATERKD